MLWLIISILALVAGVLLSSWVRTIERWPSLLHGFVVGFVGFLLLLEVMPEVVEDLGLIAWGYFMGGLTCVFAIERLLPEQHSTVATILMAVALGIHALLDGAALGTQGEAFLMLAVLVHRLPMGFTIGAYFIESKTKWGALLLMILASIAGFFSVQYLPFPGLSAVQAIAAGGVAHVLLDAHIQEQPCDEDCIDVGLKYWRLGGLLCGITAFALVALIGHGEHEHIHHTEWDVVWAVLLSAILSVYMFWDRFHQHSHSH